MYDVKILERESGGKIIEIAGEHTSVRVELFPLSGIMAYRVALVVNGKETAVLAALDNGELPALLRSVGELPMPKADA